MPPPCRQLFLLPWPAPPCTATIWSWAASDVPWGAVAALVLLGSVQLWLGAAFRSVTPDGGLRSPLLRADWLVVHPGNGQAPDHRRPAGQSLGLRHRSGHRGHARLVPALQEAGLDQARGTSPPSTGQPRPVPAGHAHFSAAPVGITALCPASGLIPCAGHVHRRGMVGHARLRPGSPADGGVVPHARRGLRLPAASALCGATMAAWSISSKCFRITTASPAPNTLPPRGSPTSSSSPRWHRDAVSRVARGVYALPGADAQLDRHPLASGGAGVRHGGTLPRAVGP